MTLENTPEADTTVLYRHLFSVLCATPNAVRDQNSNTAFILHGEETGYRPDTRYQLLCGSAVISSPSLAPESPSFTLPCLTLPPPPLPAFRKIQKGRPKSVSRCCRMVKAEVSCVVEACMKMVRNYKAEVRDYSLPSRTVRWSKWFFLSSCLAVAWPIFCLYVSMCVCVRLCMICVCFCFVLF